jgi:hypothetical protein
MQIARFDSSGHMSEALEILALAATSDPKVGNEWHNIRIVLRISKILG